MEADDEATQRTQTKYDVRRTGSTASNLDPEDVADIICILHPATPAAFSIVAFTAATHPEHVLQTGRHHEHLGLSSEGKGDEQETFVLSDGQSLELALRFSSDVKDMSQQFQFGRNPARCDVVLDLDTNKRVSNVHFAVFINESGICMLRDRSTNGTLVDGIHLIGKSSNAPQTRMITSGSEIQILSNRPDENIKFIVRIPSRDGSHQGYVERFNNFMQKYREAIAHQERRERVAINKAAAPVVPRASVVKPSIAPARNTDWGMHWNGGSKYNVTGQIGRGAFATVFRLATKADGQYFAAKELEKRKFMKNGILDRKLDNELLIMKSLSHPNIVEFVDYHDHDQYLYIIMEYVPHGDLGAQITDFGPLSESTAKSMAKQVFEALGYLHTKRVTHRDIKPDNILLANSDPADFHVKLSDFGLSKVVKDNDTFLKTFCGTLLYCAPEVFPHYDNYAAAHGARKRPRKGANQKFHSYSQSVDIWSFGAVLWYALCGKTPFEGVLDSNGRGMFDRIMHNSPDISPLRDCGVSTEAVNLLMLMMNIDPAERPTPLECLQHPWFVGHDASFQPESQQEESGLNAIDEEDEELHQIFEHDLSQLRIHEGGLTEDEAEIDFDSGEFDLLNSRQSKRFKSQAHDGDSSVSESSEGNFVSGHHDAQAKESMLFGEITASALEKHNAFHRRDSMDKSGSDSENADALPHKSSNRFGTETQGARPDSFTTGRGQNINSLSGAESLVRDLNMDSPPSATSPPGARTPRTPEQRSLGRDGDSEETPTKVLELTPRPLPFSRRIDIPKSASHYFDPHDPSTHTPEYASLQSGHDFVNHPVLSASSFAAPIHPSITNPARVAGDTRLGAAVQEGITLNDDPVVTSAAKSFEQAVSQFARPAPHLGRLVTTPESFSKHTILLSRTSTLWGRAPGNKGRPEDGDAWPEPDLHVYPDGSDSRVPKRGIFVYFDGVGVKEAELAGKDWTKLPNLNCSIATEAKAGIHINGIKLLPRNSEGKRLFGRLAHGDVIGIYGNKGSRSGTQGDVLAFRVELYHGMGKDGRKAGESFKVEIDWRSA